MVLSALTYTMSKAIKMPKPGVPLQEMQLLTSKLMYSNRLKLETFTQGPSTFHIPWSQGICHTSKHWVVKNFANSIFNYMNGQQTQTYWSKQCQMTQGIQKKIDWKSLGWAMQKIPLHYRCWVAKYVSSHFATGKICKDGNSGQLCK